MLEEEEEEEEPEEEAAEWGFREWHSTTARIEFFKSSNNMWCRCEGTYASESLFPPPAPPALLGMREGDDIELCDRLPPIEVDMLLLLLLEEAAAVDDENESLPTSRREPLELVGRVGWLVVFCSVCCSHLNAFLIHFWLKSKYDEGKEKKGLRRATNCGFQSLVA